MTKEAIAFTILFGMQVLTMLEILLISRLTYYPLPPTQGPEGPPGPPGPMGLMGPKGEQGTCRCEDCKNETS